MPRLPGDDALLATELSRPLSPRDRRRLVVDRVLLEDEGDDAVTLVLDVRARPDAAAPEQHWQVRLPVSAEDLDPAVDHDAFVLTIRANLEEWWDSTRR